MRQMRPATLLLALAACGDGLAAPDAGPPDTAGAWGLVSVRYTPNIVSPEDISNAGGRPVVFLGPDGALVAITHTHDDGRANAYAPPGTSVTLIGPFRDFHTYVGANPGDEILIGTPSPPLLSANEVHVTAAVDPSANVYWISDACSAQRSFATGATEPGGADFAIGVCANGTTDLLLQSESASRPASYQYAAGVPVPLGGSIQLVGPYLPATSTVSIDVDPIAIGFVEIQQLVFARGLLFDSALYGNTLLHLVTGQGTVVAPVPTPPGTLVETNVHDTGTFGRTGLKHAVVWGPASPTIDLDLTPGTVDSLLHPPEIHGTTIEWQHARDGRRPDFVRIEMFAPGVQWSLAGPYVSNGDGVSWFELPALPPDLAPTDLTGASFTLAAIVGEDPADRPVLLNWQWPQPWPILRPTGRVLYETNNSNLE